jgi:ubiquinone/menaquinone biosynthesis C-methylase UbiE
MAFLIGEKKFGQYTYEHWFDNEYEDKEKCINKLEMEGKDKNKVIEFYSNRKEESRATQSRADGLEFHFTKKVIDKYISKESTVIEIGCGTGYYGIYCANLCKKYIGIDLSPDNLNVFNEKLKTLNIDNIETSIGDAVNLENIENDCFDLVLVLGPIYHLPVEKRESAFREAYRICKNNGIVIFAYINKLGAYLQSGILSFPEQYPNKNANECVLKYGMDDIHPELFFYATPDEIEQMAKKNGLNIIKNIGVDFIFNKEMINNMDEEKYKCWIEFSEYMCESEKCTELSIHALLICNKI